MVTSGPCRILIVEDEWLIADYFADILRDEGYDIVGPVATIAEALSTIDEERIDGAILDIRLREETSYPVATRLDGLGVPFLFLSGDPEPDRPERLQSAPTLPKPILPDELIAGIRQLLGAHAVEAPAQ